MNRRRLLLVLGVLALSALFTGWCVLLGELNGKPMATRENYEKIQEGMTEKEVEAILGTPKDYWKAEHRPGKRAYYGEFKNFQVDFDANGAVTVKHFYLPPESFVGRLRRWLHL